ncbi:hypothetical protein [Isoptericola sp. NPDC057559]|uniref:hypothetical protein n=1 Tax=Isoptericola sp. NPDC057559 TaxID=3346168 RepID=UPI0036C98A31
MRISPLRLAPLAVVSLLALAACSPGDAAGFDDAGATAQVTDGATTSPAADGEDDADPASNDSTTGSGEGSGEGSGGGSGRPGVDFPDPDDVIADATFTVPGTEDKKVRIGVESVVVSGRTTELRLVMTPEFDDGGQPASFYDATGEAPALTLIDRENLKEYSVLEADGGGRWYRSDPVFTTALPGQSVGYQAFFAAPEDDITAVDVKLADSMPVFEDVPLTFED